MKSNHQIHVRAEFNTENGKKENSRNWIQEMSRMVKNNYLDTKNYQFYLNRTETKCISIKHIFFCKIVKYLYRIMGY